MVIIYDFDGTLTPYSLPQYEILKKCGYDNETIDFIDIFPESEDHRKKLDEEVSKISRLIDSTKKGNFYLLNNPVETKWGKLKFLKIRFFDESRLKYEAAPDFAVKDWNKLKQQVQIDKRFTFISRPNWNAVEFKTEASKNMIEVARKNAPKAQFKVMDIRNLEFLENSFDAIICFATLIHVNDTECIKILDRFDEILKNEGLIAINVMEWLDDKKEIFEDEPFNPKYKTYFNRYKKEFFTDYFQSKNYSILAFFDNPLFNSSEVKGKVANSNQFSIIVKK